MVVINVDKDISIIGSPINSYGFIKEFDICVDTLDKVGSLLAYEGVHEETIIDAKRGIEAVVKNCHVKHSDCVYIDKFKVKEEIRGNGLGSILIKNVIDYYKGNVVCLHVAMSNDTKRLYDYYQRIGFRIVKGQEFCLGMMFDNR